METTFKEGADLEVGDKLLTEEGELWEVAFIVVEGMRIHLAFRDRAEGAVLEDGDVVEVLV